MRYVVLVHKNYLKNYALTDITITELVSIVLDVKLLKSYEPIISDIKISRWFHKLRIICVKRLTELLAPGIKLNKSRWSL